MPTRCCRRGSHDEPVARCPAVDRLCNVLSCAALVACLVSGHGRAEMSEDDYRSGSALANPAERERAAAELAAERLRAAELDAQRASGAAARRAQEALLAQRRPLGERLLLRRCTGCHTLAVTDGLAHGVVGWRVTVERMRWWHGAPLESGEAAVIASHLRIIRPTTELCEWLEALLAGAGIVATVLLPVVWQRLRGRRVDRR